MCLSTLDLDLTEEARELQYSLMYVKEKLSQDDFVDEFSKWSEADQLKATILLKDFHSKAMAIGAEDENSLDSGSGRHINRKVRILDPDSSVSLTGFDDSKQWTQGIGFLPLEAHDEFTHETFKFDVTGVDQLDSVTSSIFSLGKLYKDGWHFHFDEDGLFGITPGGAHKVRLQLGEDNILKFPSKIRENADSEPMAQPYPVGAVKRKIDKATAELLHEMFNHSSKEKIYQTLGVTRGYKQSPLPEVDCSACPIGKAHRKGLSHKTNVIIESVDIKDGFISSEPYPTPPEDSGNDESQKILATYGDDSSDEEPSLRVTGPI